MACCHLLFLTVALTIGTNEAEVLGGVTTAFENADTLGRTGFMPPESCSCSVPTGHDAADVR